MKCKKTIVVGSLCDACLKQYEMEQAEFKRQREAIMQRSLVQRHRVKKNVEASEDDTAFPYDLFVDKPDLEASIQREKAKQLYELKNSNQLLI